MVMMINELNTGLIEALKEKLPPKDKSQHPTLSVVIVDDADWQEDRIYGTIRKYQPEAMIINNTGLDSCGKTFPNCPRRRLTGSANAASGIKKSFARMTKLPSSTKS